MKALAADLFVKQWTLAETSMAEGLTCKPQPLSCLPEFTGVQISFKVENTTNRSGWDGLNHRE